MRAVTPGIRHLVHGTVIKSVLFELEKGCLTIRDTQRRIYCIAAACNPFLQGIAPSLRNECMNVAEEEYGRILQSLGERTLTRSRESYARYMTSVVDDIPQQEIPSKASFLAALKFRELDEGVAAGRGVGRLLSPLPAVISGKVREEDR